MTAPHEDDAGGSAVGDDVVHLPADRVEVSPRFGIFLIGGQFLRPPRDMVDAVSRSGLALERHEPSLKIRGIRLQNPILNIVAFCAAHGEEAAALQLKDLAAHQVQHMRANAMYLAAVPLRYWISFQCVIVFMVAADEGKREGQAFQPIQRFIVAAVAKPHAAKVAVIPNSGQWRLYRVNFYTEKFQNPVNKQILHKIFRYSIFNPVYRGLALHSCFSRVSQCLR